MGAVLSHENGNETEREQGDKSRLRILAAAAETFVNGGYDGASIDAIADRLGATKGHVYHYYRSKADLFLAVHVLACQRILDLVGPLARGPEPPPERLWRMAHAHARLMMTDQPTQRVSVQGVAFGFPKRTTEAQRATVARIIELRDEYEGLFADVVAEGVATGDFAAVEPRLASKPLLGGLNWVSLWFRPEQGDDEATVDRIARAVADQAVWGVGKVGSRE